MRSLMLHGFQNLLPLLDSFPSGRKFTEDGWQFSLQVFKYCVFYSRILKLVLHLGNVFSLKRWPEERVWFRIVKYSGNPLSVGHRWFGRGPSADCENPLSSQSCITTPEDSLSEGTENNRPLLLPLFYFKLYHQCNPSLY
jgi:hypothetical protein